jgi:hypothetical protein
MGAMEWRSRCTVAHPMRSCLLIPLLLGSLGGCALVFEDEGSPAEAPPPDIDQPPAPSPAQEGKALLAEWSGCMSLTNFMSAQMAPTWSGIISADGSCTTCHTEEGSPAFPVSSNADAFFKVISERVFPMLLFFSVDLTSSPGKVIITQPLPLQNVGSGQPPYMAHPRFTLGAAPINALTTFYDATVARKVAGECDPPRLID